MSDEPFEKVAFILYFVPETWCKADGGALDLFDAGPEAVVRSLPPRPNSAAFFEVHERSWHQVAEVLSKDKTRLSVGGWFHAPDAEGRPGRKVRQKEEEGLLPAVDISEEDFYGWIDPAWLDPSTQAEIRSQFESTSEISLPNFLAAEKHRAVSEALARLRDGLWEVVGQRCRSRCETLDLEGVDGGEDLRLVNRCADFLMSDALLLVLSGITELTLHPMASDHDGSDSSSSNAAKCRRPRVRRWRRGCYTLLHDDEQESSHSLDARLFFNCESWSAGCGGYSSYVVKDEDEELLTVTPEANTFNLVYKDAETLRFIKYVSDEVNSLTGGQFHDVAVAYKE